MENLTVLRDETVIHIHDVDKRGFRMSRRHKVLIVVAITFLSAFD